VNDYPASEQRISDVERGRITDVVLPMPPGRSLSAGDAIVFAVAYSPAGQGACYVSGGDSIRVSLTEVTALGRVDPATGEALFRLSWERLGHGEPPDPIAQGDVDSRGPHGRSLLNAPFGICRRRQGGPALAFDPSSTIPANHSLLRLPPPVRSDRSRPPPAGLPIGTQ
jgi:hypothetical protein